MMEWLLGDKNAHRQKCLEIKTTFIWYTSIASDEDLIIGKLSQWEITIPFGGGGGNSEYWW